MPTTEEIRRDDVNWYGEELTYFSAETMNVDGIQSSIFPDSGLPGVYRAPMFSVKNDTIDAEYRDGAEDEEGFMRNPHLVAWSGRYEPAPYSDGDVNEEIWLQFGVIMVPGDPDYGYYMNILERRASRGA